MSAKIRLCVVVFEVTQVDTGGVRQGSGRPGVCGGLSHRLVGPGRTWEVGFVGGACWFPWNLAATPVFPSLLLTPAACTSVWQRSLCLPSAWLSRWFEALWLLPEGQMDSFHEGQGTNEDEKISLCSNLLCEKNVSGCARGELARTGVCEKQGNKF